MSAPREHPRTAETLSWEDADWRYRVEEQGHLFRFRATYRQAGKEPVAADFGLIPGGAFVALERLVRARPARRPPEPHPAPEGYRWQARPEHGLSFRLASGGRCRQRGCVGTVVAELHRRHRGRPQGQWWRYCAVHLFGRWVEGGAVWGWHLVPEDGGMPS